MFRVLDKEEINFLQHQNYDKNRGNINNSTINSSIIANLGEEAEEVTEMEIVSAETASAEEFPVADEE